VGVSSMLIPFIVLKLCLWYVPIIKPQSYEWGYDVTVISLP